MVKRLFIWDTALCIKIFNWTGRRFIDWTMRHFSYIGDGFVYIVFAIILSIVNFNMAKSLIPALLIAFVIEITIQKIAKNLAKRSRPCNIIPEINNLISLPDEFSFPSGHTAGAFIMAALLSHEFSSLLIPFYLVASLVGFSRIYNGVHYPSDVFMGALLGILSALIGEWIIY